MDKYTEELNQRIITGPMLEEALFSVNKLAKNYRDDNRIIRSKFAQHNQIEMYRKKEVLLSLLKPAYVHQELINYNTIRCYEGDDDYFQTLCKEGLNENISKFGGYFDKDTYEELEYFDYYNRECPQYQYYLFYILGEHSFHTPIRGEDLTKYNNLERVTIGKLKTTGWGETQLLDINVVNSIVKLIESGNYTFKNDLNTTTLMGEYENLDPEAFKKDEIIEIIWDYIKYDVIKELKSIDCDCSKFLNEIEKEYKNTLKDRLKNSNQMKFKVDREIHFIHTHKDVNMSIVTDVLNSIEVYDYNIIKKELVTKLTDSEFHQSLVVDKKIKTNIEKWFNEVVNCEKI